MINVCEHCKWYAPRDARHGECWHSPPQVVELRKSDDDEIEDMVISRRPRTFRLTRCSHWEAEKCDAESRDQQKFQYGFRAGTGCSAECMAVVEGAEYFIRNQNDDAKDALRSAVLDLVSARDFE